VKDNQLKSLRELKDLKQFIKNQEWRASIPISFSQLDDEKLQYLLS
jgi:hypothetical protein